MTKVDAQTQELLLCVQEALKLTSTQAKRLCERLWRFSASIRQEPLHIDSKKCTNCGLCLDRCPADGAVLQGFSKNNIPFYAISEEKCLYLKDKSCSICRDECSETAIDLDNEEFEHSIEADAVLIATGFKPFDPKDKPYGFGLFKNVVTGLDLERMIKRTGCVKKPSDNKTPGQIVETFSDGTFVVQCQVDTLLVLNYEAPFGWQPQIGNTLNSLDNKSWFKLAHMQIEEEQT